MGCPKYEKMLLSDVTGVLDDGLRFSWESHLKRCEACRQEKERLQAMIKRMKSTSATPALSPAEADTMVARINRQLTMNKKRPSLFSAWTQTHGKLISAAVAACLLFIVTGILWFDNRPQQFGQRAMTIPRLGITISQEEIDIITDFELLEELDSLEKIVQLVDYSEPTPATTDKPNNSHGSLFYEKNIRYC